MYLNVVDVDEVELDVDETTQRHLWNLGTFHGAQQRGKASPKDAYYH